MSIRRLSKIRKNDPFFQREATKYDMPLPSREYIVQTLVDQGRPVSLDFLCDLLDVRKVEREPFVRRLAAMEREAQLMRNRKGAYILPERASLIAGRVEGHPDGYGFLIPDDGGDDLFLDARQMTRVLHRDRALARVTGVDRKGRREAAIVEVTERANRIVVGRVLIEHGIMLLAPENRRIHQDILIVADRQGDKRRPRHLPQAGQVAMAEIIEQPTRHSQPIGRIVEVLGNYADPGMEIEIALRKHELPFEFSPEVLKEARALPAKVRKADLEGRRDLRGLPLVTIDGETAKDFDDAVFAEKKGRGWHLLVAIADVSHYVRPGAALDREAFARGNSVYFPRRVIPMLPEKLSNGLCSLNPEADRLAMVCDMDISASGAIKAYEFYPAVFRSAARLTYAQVWAWLSGASEASAAPLSASATDPSIAPSGAASLESPIHAGLQPSLRALYATFGALLKARQKRGAIDFETTETMMLFDEQGKIENIVPVQRNDAHRLIEECMLAANVCAADFLEKRRRPCLYRIHEGPTPEKLDNLRAFLKEFGLVLPGGDHPKAKDYAALMGAIQSRPDAGLLQTAMLRSLRQAVYSPDNAGHFGLSYERYTHFTSPIRRYPDLLVHRAIKAALADESCPSADQREKWDEIGLHCSMTERRADEAARDVTNWLKCYYMRERIGELFFGTIASVVPFGVFVTLDAVYVEGLLHVSELGEDYFQFDPVRHEMRGERTGRRFRLGERLCVKLVRADLESGRIDFVLPEPSEAAAWQAAQQRESGLAGEPADRPASGKGTKKAAKNLAKSAAKKTPQKTAKKTPKKASPGRASPAPSGKTVRSGKPANARKPGKS